MLNIHSFLPKKCNKKNKGQEEKINYEMFILALSLIVVLVVVPLDSFITAPVYAAEEMEKPMEETAEVVQITSNEYVRAMAIGTEHLAVEVALDLQMLDIQSMASMSAGDWAKATKEKMLDTQRAEEEAKQQKEREIQRKKEEEQKKAAEKKAKEEAAKRKAEKERIAKEKAEKKKKEAEEKAAREKKAAEEKAAAEKKAAEKKAAEAKAAAQKYSVSISEEDKYVLQRIVEAEATGQEVKGKMMVANVILNRVKSKTFPNTVAGVVFQKGQFSPISDGRYYSVNITSTTKEAVERVLKGEDNSQGALYFMARKYATKNNARWFDNNLTWVTSYGGHEFYK